MDDVDEVLMEYYSGRAIRGETVLRNRIDPLARSDEHLIRYYRFPRCEIIAMAEEFDEMLRPKTEKETALSPCQKILVALRFYASGSFQSLVADTIVISQSSVSNIVNQVSNILHAKADSEIKMPTTVTEQSIVASGFSRAAGLPRIIGAIDGTHIRVKAPSTSAEGSFVNRKGFHSLNVQLVCSSNYVIQDYCCRFPGSTHDSHIWRMCTLRQRFVAGQYGALCLIGDSGYPSEPWLLTPFANPSVRGERKFNNAHAKTRVCVEQAIGVLKSRWRCLHHSGGTLLYRSRTTGKIIVACLLLHNRCIRRNIPLDLGDDPMIQPDPSDEAVNPSSSEDSAPMLREEGIVDTLFS